MIYLLYLDTFCTPYIHPSDSQRVSAYFVQIRMSRLDFTYTGKGKDENRETLGLHVGKKRRRQM
jgi:hypothetical protein